MINLVNKLRHEMLLTRDEFKQLLLCDDEGVNEYLFRNAREVCDISYGREIYMRGLIEFTNYCKNDCYYCGIRNSNRNMERYRLTKEQIMECCNTGYRLGFRTFVLQGGEDPYFTDERIVDIIRSIKSKYPDCALTLSIGEKSRQSYQDYFDAGADRYLIRHETADSGHYSKLHPSSLTLENRIRCLNDLKEIGFQTGCGIMVGSPFQTIDNIVNDLFFMKEFKPHMVGIGPFIPHHDTPFRDEPHGSEELTLKLLSIVRLMLPDVLLPATTALGTIDGNGREKGILAGANVVMPNLSPKDVRAKYLLYDNKISTGDEAAESKSNLEKRIRKIGYNLVVSRGDCRAVK